MDDYEMQREKMALEYDVQLYRQYGEEQAAHKIGVDLSWMKRNRDEDIPNPIPHVQLSTRKIRYFGFQIIDILNGKRTTWDAIRGANSNSASTSSPNAPEVPPGIDAGGKVTPQDASASARRILRKPSRD